MLLTKYYNTKTYGTASSIIVLEEMLAGQEVLILA